MKSHVLFVAVLAVTTTFTPVNGQALQNSSPSDGKQQQLDAAYAEAEHAMTIRLLDRCLSEAKTDLALLNEANAKAAALSKRLSDLQNNDDGKRLAMTIDYITANQLRRLMDDPPVPQAQLVALSAELQEASSSLQKLRDNPPTGFVPSDSQQDELMKIRVTLTGGVARLNERTKWLDTLLSGAPKSSNVAAAPTLEAAMADLFRRQQQDWAAAQRLGVEQAQPEAREQITSAAKAAELERALEQSRQLLADSRAQVEQLRMEDEMRLAQSRNDALQREQDLKAKLAEAQAARTRVDAQIDTHLQQAQQDAEMIRRRQECRRPEVLAALAPLTAPGFWQPGKNAPSIGKQPISLTSLQDSGALAPTLDGLKALYEFGSNRRDSLRPRWSFNYHKGSFHLTTLDAASYEQLQKVQQYLIQYGDALVAEGLLAK